MKNKLYLFLRIFVSILLVGLLFWMMKDRLGQIVITIKNANFILIAICFFIYIIVTITVGIRLRKVLAVQGINLSVKEATYLCFLGYFFNNFLPTAVGGDIVKAYYAAKKSNKKLAAYSGVFMDRLLATVPFTFIPTFALIFAYKDIDNPLLMYLIFTLFIMTLLMLSVILNKRLALFFKFFINPIKPKKIYQKISKIYNSLNVYRRHKIVLTWSFLLSLAGQALSIISFFILAKAINVNNVGLEIFFLLIPIVSIMSLLPSINGLGVREAGLVYMFKRYMPASTAFAIALLSLGILLGLSLIGAFIYMFGKNIYTFKMETEDDVL